MIDESVLAEVKSVYESIRKDLYPHLSISFESRCQIAAQLTQAYYSAKHLREAKLSENI